MREAAYNIAVGQNIQKIMDAQKEEILRSASADAALTPDGATGRDGAGGNSDVPKPKDVLPKDSIAALKNKGISVDEHYKRMGYSGGWVDFWEKRGKAYFGDPDEED